MSDSLRQVLQGIDELNEQDPNRVMVNGVDWAVERLYSERMTDCLFRFCPEASDYLQIAARAQHVERWISKREDYPAGKAGYLKWRRELGQHHANTACRLMAKAGYRQDEQDRVYRLLTKQAIKQNPEMQSLEDVICLVFIEHYFLAFAGKHSEEKVIDIVRKTWEKMSGKGQDAALDLDLPDSARHFIGKALTPTV